MQWAEEKQPPTINLCICPSHPYFHPSVYSLTFCFYSSQLSYKNTRAFKSTTSQQVQTLSPGEHRAKQRDSSPELQSKAKMDNICICDDSQLQVVWLIQLIITARYEHHHCGCLHKNMSFSVTLWAFYINWWTAQVIIPILQGSQNNSTWLVLSFRFSRITDISHLYNVVELGELAYTLHWRLEWYPCWNDPCVTGALRRNKVPSTCSISWKESSVVTVIFHHIFLFYSYSLFDEFSDVTAFLEISVWRWQTQPEEPEEEKRTLSMTIMVQYVNGMGRGGRKWFYKVPWGWWRHLVHYFEIFSRELNSWPLIEEKTHAINILYPQ